MVVVFLVHWLVRHGFGYLWEMELVVGLHLFGEVSGVLVVAHYNLEQWAQN